MCLFPGSQYTERPCDAMLRSPSLRTSGMDSYLRWFKQADDSLSYCILCSGNILIPPTERARKLADYVKVAIGLHLFLAIFLMIGGRYVDGVMDLLGALIGFYSIKNAEGYSFQCGEQPIATRAQRLEWTDESSTRGVGRRSCSEAQSGSLESMCLSLSVNASSAVLLRVLRSVACCTQLDSIYAAELPLPLLVERSALLPAHDFSL